MNNPCSDSSTGINSTSRGKIFEGELLDESEFTTFAQRIDIRQVDAIEHMRFYDGICTSIAEDNARTDFQRLIERVNAEQIPG